MNSAVIDIFTRLGRRLAAFSGSADADADARRAARNIAEDMLTREALTAWLAHYPALPASSPRRQSDVVPRDARSADGECRLRNVLIVMAGNIPFVGLHDLVCVLAAGHRAIVKPSSKDAGAMSWVVSQLLEISPDLPISIISDDIYRQRDESASDFADGGRGAVKLPTAAEAVQLSTTADAVVRDTAQLSASPFAAVRDTVQLPASPDAVIAMGSSDTVRALRDRYAGVPVLLRGHRSSLAVLTGQESPAELAGLADDIFMYSGLGCRNVSLILVPRRYDFSELQNALYQRKTSPDRKWHNSYLQSRALLRMAGTPHLDYGSCLLVENRNFSDNISVVNYAFYDDLYEAMDWVAEHDSEIQCVACGQDVSFAGDLPRSVALGQTQRPGLTDYPDGCDTMRFLLDMASRGKKHHPEQERSPHKKTLISIAGPTGSGKTDLAIELAIRLNSPVISTDSRQMYRGMAIGTAQPTLEQQTAVKHYFIADREPTDRFSCADFEREALVLLERLFAEHDYVVAVGGSGLYIDALCDGLDDIPDADLELRKVLNNRLSREGLQPLLEELRDKDPQYYEQVDRQNPARIVRALEVCIGTGKPFSSFRKSTTISANSDLKNATFADEKAGTNAQKTVNSVARKDKTATEVTFAARPRKSRPFDIIKIGTDIPRPELYERIDRRVDMMMEAGLEAEVHALFPIRHLPALQTVGYRELFDHFNGKYSSETPEKSLARAVELIKRNSRRYAKRQLTWFRRDPEIQWFGPRDPDTLSAIIKYIKNRRQPTCK